MTMYQKQNDGELQYRSAPMNIAYGKSFDVDPKLMKQMNLTLHRKDFISLTKKNVQNFVIVTATDKSHYPGLFSMIVGIQKFRPNQRIFVYDLGMTPAQHEEIQTACNVVVRRLDFSKYPPHVQLLIEYAWKPIIIHVSSIR